MTLIRRRSSTISQLLGISSSASILTSLRRCKSIRSLEQVHPLIIQKGCDQDPFLLTHFISLCFSLSSDLSYPTRVFHSVYRPNIFLWNALIKGYCKHSSLDNSIPLFNRMRNSLDDIMPDDYTFTPLIKCCANSSALMEGRLLHGLIIRCGIEDSVFVGSSLIGLYGKCGEIERARKVFDGMSLKNEVCWTAMVVGYLYFGDTVEAQKLFVRMPERNPPSWNAMIGGFTKIGDLNSAKVLFDEMPDKDAVTYTTMIDGYAKAGDMASTREFFERSQQKDLIL